MSLVGRLLRAAGGSDAVVDAARRANRAAFVARARAAASWSRADLTLVVAPDVRVGRHVEVRVQPGTVNVLRIGEGCLLDDGVRIQLKGGTVELGPRVDVRRHVLMNVAGHLVCEGDNLVSWGAILHCVNDVRVGRQSVISERVTLVDSSHFFTTEDDPVLHNVRPGSVVVGRNTWVAAKATLARGSRVGDHCIVSANSLVTGEVPDGHLASGVPATVVRPLDLPWRSPPGS